MRRRRELKTNTMTVVLSTARTRGRQCGRDGLARGHGAFPRADRLQRTGSPASPVTYRESVRKNNAGEQIAHISFVRSRQLQLIYDQYILTTCVGAVLFSNTDNSKTRE